MRAVDKLPNYQFDFKGNGDSSISSLLEDMESHLTRIQSTRHPAQLFSSYSSFKPTKSYTPTQQTTNLSCAQLHKQLPIHQSTKEQQQIVLLPSKIERQIQTQTDLPLKKAFKKESIEQKIRKTIRKRQRNTCCCSEMHRTHIDFLHKGRPTNQAPTIRFSKL